MKSTRVPNSKMSYLVEKHKFDTLPDIRLINQPCECRHWLIHFMRNCKKAPQLIGLSPVKVSILMS